MAAKKQFETIDEYIESFPEDVRGILENVREAIRKVVPEAVEAISYQIPAFKLKGRNLVHFAGWKKHISVYPIPAGDAAFHQEVSRYQTGKGTVQFPLGKPIPYELVEKIVRFRVREI